MSNQDMLITVFGGSGFLGRHVVRALARRRFRIRVAVRRPDLAGHLQPLGTVGQIHAVQANVRVRGSVEVAARDSDILINLVGILAERGRQTFDTVHVEGARTIAETAAATGARVIHVSAIGADVNSTADYAVTKALGEAAVLAAAPAASIIRPSIMFGPEDDFFNRFAAIARMSPVLPLVGEHTRFQPVFVGDVASAIAQAAEGATRPGVAYELGGPEIRTFRELMEYVLETIERRRLLLPLPFGLASLLARFTQFLPNAPLTPGQVEMLKHDNVVSDAAKADRRTLEDLGIAPTSMATIVPTYLWRFRRTGQFQGHVA